LPVRKSSSVDVNIYKIQKTTNFTHFTPKIFHISLFKTVHIYTFATVIVRTVTIAMYPIILLISHFAPFFSLSSPSAKPTHTSSLPHYFLLPLIHTNTPTQTNQHKNAQNQNPPSLTVSGEPARAPTPKHRSHHPPHIVQPSAPNHHQHHLLKQPPPPNLIKTTETQNPHKINSKLNH